MESLLALCLILMPPSIKLPEPSPLMCLYVDAVARQLELVDADTHVDGWPQPRDLGEGGVLDVARERWQEMRDWPPCADVQLLPSLETVRLSREQSLRLRESLADLALLRPGWRYEMELDEAQQLYRIWDTADDAQCWPSVYERRRALHVIRETLGDDAYYRGDWPPPVPLWWFESED